ncbi:Ubiquitin fusion degradation protein 4 [Coemansia sp. RSA 1853]|nr:Ubiquitin fusion degradation protein 4 [Coemansia sp. RSA 638]KAJ2541371.1 Ubiquitin fusion degradation protein 4 [Coemansia sp. RSA 1853]
MDASQAMDAPQTPGGRRILAASASDSPLPPLVEVGADDVPEAITLVSPEDVQTMPMLTVHEQVHRESEGDRIDVVAHNSSSEDSMQLDSEAGSSHELHNHGSSLMDVNTGNPHGEHISAVSSVDSEEGSSDEDSSGEDNPDEESSDEDNSDEHSSESDDAEDDDGSKDTPQDDVGGIFGGSRLFGLGLGSAVRMGNAQRFRPLIAALGDSGDESQQLIALQELTELLAMATEETLIGVDVSSLVQTLIALANGPSPELAGIIAGNANIMLLACRCLSNLLEALPLAGSVLLRHGVVDMLCTRLLDIEYIDVAEQALTVLTQLSRDSATRVCAGGGLSACLMFLDFFATNTQHTALTCAANCARAIGNDQFGQAADAVPVLERTMFYSDPKTADLSCSALLHLAVAFRSSPERVERLVSIELLQRIVASIRSGDSAARHTSAALLRLLVTVASASRKRAMQLLGLDVIPVLCGILTVSCADLPDVSTDVSNTTGLATAGSRQHRSAVHMSEQAWEALRLTVTLLPRLPASDSSLERMEALVRDKCNSNSPNLADGDSVSDCCLQLQAIYSSPRTLDQLQHTLLPLMLRMFASTINTPARYRVLLVVLKVVFCLDADRLRAALYSVDLPQFVVAAVSLQNSPLLSATALLIIRVVLEKLPGHYTQRFVREGVVDGLSTLVSTAESVLTAVALPQSSRSESTDDEDNEECEDGESNTGDATSNTDDAENSLSANSEAVEPHTLLQGFKLIDVHVPSSARHGTISASQRPLFVSITIGSGSSATVNGNLSRLIQWILVQARILQQNIGDGLSSTAGNDGCHLRQLQQTAEQLATSDSAMKLRASIEALSSQLISSDGVTCYELMQSGLVQALIHAFGCTDDSGLLKAGESVHVVDSVALLMQHHSATEPHSLSTSAFGVLLSRLQEALGLVEELRVNEAYQTGADELQPPAHMLSKQVRFSVRPAGSQVTANTASSEQMEQIRRSFQTIRVSVHAVSTFSVLEAYLRPRIALIARSNRQRRRQGRQTDEPEASTSGNLADETRSGNLQPQHARLDTRADSSASEKSEQATERGARCDREHLRMLQMIAQESGIDLRAAGLIDGLNADNGSSDSEVDDDNMASEQSSQGAAGGNQNSAVNAGETLLDSPGDWHLSFILRVGNAERTVSAADNIFRIIYELCHCDPVLKDANPWMQTFELQFYVESGPSLSVASETPPHQLLAHLHGLHVDKELETSIGKRGASIVQLLRVLSDLTPQARSIARIDDTVDADRLFINHKVTAKTARQLEDPLIVVCSALPSWCYRLAGFAPFLVSFETRLALLQATCFGYSRNINYWQNLARRERRGSSNASDSTQIPLGRVQRQKVRISRHRMLESALKMLELYGTPKSILEVEYYDEVGSGIGPTLEFYATISRCLQERELGLWRDERSPVPEAHSEYVYAPHGLFPAPMDSTTVSDCAQSSEPADTLPPNDRTVQLFKFAGHLISKGLIDGRILDIPLNTEFWAAVQRYLLPASDIKDVTPWSWAQLEAVDAQLTKSLRYLYRFVEAKNEIYARVELSPAQRQNEIDAIRNPDDQVAIADLALDFTLPGYPGVELRQGGAEIPVTMSNIHSYIDLVAEWTLHTGVRAQVAAFCQGFDRVFSSTCLLMFTPAELCSLIGQTVADDAYWSGSALRDSIKIENGFSLESPEVCMFIEFLESLDQAERRLFLQFVTGAPRLPLGGFHALHPPLRLMPRQAVLPLKPDDYLPSVMTCMNLIKLPKYSSFKVFSQRWKQVMVEGQKSFHLS